MLFLLLGLLLLLAGDQPAWLAYLQPGVGWRNDVLLLADWVVAGWVPAYCLLEEGCWVVGGWAAWSLLIVGWLVLGLAGWDWLSDGLLAAGWWLTGWMAGCWLKNIGWLMLAGCLLVENWHLAAG